MNRKEKIAFAVGSAWSAAIAGVTCYAFYVENVEVSFEQGARVGAVTALNEASVTASATYGKCAGKAPDCDELRHASSWVREYADEEIAKLEKKGE